MIVQAIKKQTVDVEIDPVSVLNDLEETWKLVVCRVPKDSHIGLGGHWVSDEKIIRKVTKRELSDYEAFNRVVEITECLED